jgi:hypothetical protein
MHPINRCFGSFRRKLNNYPLLLVNWLIIMAVFLFFLYPMADADLGWHLRYGDYFLTHHRLLIANEFSWAMPDYIWPNHSWGYDILAASIYQFGGLLALSVAGAFLITLTFFLATRHLKPLPLVIAAGIFIYFGSQLLNIGLRSQLISLFYTVYLWVSLQNFVSSKKAKHLFAIPLLFLFWANLHGQHLIGLGLLWLYTIGTFIDRREIICSSRKHHLLLISLISSAVILINPYGINLFTTTLSHLSNPALDNIFEWMPWEFNNLRMIIFLGYIGFFWFHILKLPRRLSLSNLLVYAALTIFALKARRMIPFFILVSLPLWTTFLNLPPIFSKKRFAAILTFILILLNCAFVLALIPSRHLFAQTWDSYCRGQVLCSEPLVAFLRQHHIKGKLFTAYRLGGHLIYRYPEAKVFIDGRMTVWQDYGHHSPFMDYLTIIHNYPGAEALFKIYNFDYVIIHPEFALTAILDNQESWSKIYDDGTVRVYQNPRVTTTPK